MKTLLQQALEIKTGKRSPSQSKYEDVSDEHVELLFAYIKGDIDKKQYDAVRASKNVHYIIYQDAYRVLRYLFYNLRIKK